MNYEFKGSRGPWFTDLNEGAVYDKDGYFLMSFGYNPVSVQVKDRINIDLKLASKAPEMFEMLSKICEAAKRMNLEGDIDHKEIEQLLKEATEL